MPTSLPVLIKLADYGNDWEKYLQALYRIYLDKVAHGGIIFRGLPLRVQFRPMSQGKGFGFWHLISEGKVEEERTPDLRRCERIRWIPWVISNAESNAEIVQWENKRDHNRHVVLWLRGENFVVILAKRKDYYLLKSAYTLKPHRVKAFEREWKESQENG